MQQQYQQYSNPSTTRYHSGATTTQCGGNYVSANERVQSTRKVSSTILNEQYLSPIPQDLPTREIEVSRAAPLLTVVLGSRTYPRRNKICSSQGNSRDRETSAEVRVRGG